MGLRDNRYIVVVYVFNYCNVVLYCEVYLIKVWEQVVCGQKKNIIRLDCLVGLLRDNIFCESDIFLKKLFIFGEGGSNCVNVIIIIFLVIVFINFFFGVDFGMNYSGVLIFIEELELFYF